MRGRRMGLWASVAVVAISDVARDGHAVDMTIAKGQRLHAPQTLAGAGDRLTVEAGGTLSTAPTAVLVTGANATIRNSGSISVSDAGAYGLQSSAADTTVFNLGSLTTTGECAYGVYATGARFTLINHGTIATVADNNSWGVHVNAADARIVNRGRIETAGEDANGIELYGRGGRVINSGTLTTAGVNAIGIYSWHTTGVMSDTVISNSGTIRTTGAGAQGIWANARGLQVVNSGTVASRFAEAIYMGQADQGLTLLAGSVIDGEIYFAQPGTATLTIGRGLDALLTLDGIPATIDTSGQPYRLDGNRLAVLGTEPMLAGVTTGIATASAVSGTIGQRFSGRRQGGADSGLTPLGYAPLAYAPVPAAPVFPDFAPRTDHGAWTSGFGSFSVPLDDDGLHVNQGGVLFGLESGFDDGSMAGLFAGIGQGAARGDNGTRVETTTFLGGGYGSVDLGAGFVEASATLGATMHDSARRIANNAVAGGVEIARGDYRGAFFSPSVTYGMDQSLGALRMTPRMTLAYAGIYQQGYDETGSAANLSLGSQFTHVVTARGEIELAALETGAEADGFDNSLRLGVEGSWRGGAAARGTMLGTAIAFDDRSELEARGFLGADLGFTKGRYAVSARGDLGLSTGGALTFDVSSGLRIAF